MLKWLKSWLNMIKYDTTPDLQTFDQVIDFTDKQAAFVSQVTLYTYIKTRAGTQYPKLFENEDYLRSLKIARWHIFCACVSDLSVFIAARLYKEAHCPSAQAAAFAQHIGAIILSQIEQDDVPASIFDEAVQQLTIRAQEVDFLAAAMDDYAFQTSSDALLKWAPVIERFKQLDDEIVRNSIHLRWISVRRDIIRGMNNDAIYAAWQVAQTDGYNNTSA